jgi:hypothetical protein
MTKGKKFLPATISLRVDEAKVLNYLLNDQHHEGKSKSKYFKACGFSRDAWADLRTALIAHGKQRPIVSTEVNQYGTKHVVECEIKTPDGKNRCIRTVWVIEPNTEIRLITAYPVT